jgi:hypothetical protein
MPKRPAQRHSGDPNKKTVYANNILDEEPSIDNFPGQNPASSE